MVDLVLDDAEIRVLGVLLEKELTTPDYYPLSLNALKNACNQTTNRDPIVSYNDAVISAALAGLIEKKLAWDAHLSRVAKYGQNLTEKANMVPREAIILALLMLRGAQTAGELRGRSARVHPFEQLEDVLAVLEDLKAWGYVQQLPRQAGRKESRYAHLFSKSAETDDAQEEGIPKDSGVSSDREKIAALEAETQSLRTELAQLKQAFTEFKNQF